MGWIYQTEKQNCRWISQKEKKTKNNHFGDVTSEIDFTGNQKAP